MNSLRVRKLIKDTPDTSDGGEVSTSTPPRWKNWPLIIIFLVLIAFFWKFFFKALLPIPADTIVGMYHPWRDIVWDNLTAGVPFKNFLITDPVRQQYPWRWLVVNLFKKGQLPSWNPYTHAGTPLLANLQSAVFYPLNVLFFILSFNLSWTVLVFLQPFLSGIFLYLYLRHLKLKKIACLMGALSFSFSGFFTAWLEWGTILHVGLWLPLVLLSIDKIFECFEKLHLGWWRGNDLDSSEVGLRGKICHLRGVLLATSEVIGKNKKLLAWEIILILSLVASFFAGHPQTSFYLVLFSLIYLAWRLSRVKKNRFRLITLFTIHYSLFILITSIQWLPTLRFIQLSARELDQIDWQKPGWFIPWQHLVQFLAPDFFGNPATLNYWGEWNYGEFIGYIGVIPLILAFYAIFCRREKKSWFFSSLVFLFLSFALPTPWAKLPYQLEIPLISTSQPARLLFLVDFCLAVLAALGLDSFLSHSNDTYHWSKKRIFIPLLTFGFLYGGLWLFVFLAPRIWPEFSWISSLAVSKRNLILPTGIAVAFAGLTLGYWLVLKLFAFFPPPPRRASAHLGGVLGLFVIRNSKFIILLAILLLTIFDLLRFGWKFTPFVKNEWLFPDTKTLEFLKSDQSTFRFMSTDRRLFPPNFSVVYKLQTVDGYDPLYLRRYGELIAASERGEPNISSPFGFNRIITPQNYQSRIIDFLNVKYILSLTDQDSPKLDLVFQEGETRVYKNKNVFPRAFMVYDYRIAKNKEEAINLLMDENIDLTKVVILGEEPAEVNFQGSEKMMETGENEVKIENYQENWVLINVQTSRWGLLILSDSYYPGWKAQVDEKEVKIYRANYNFRAVVVPAGNHQVIFKCSYW